MTIIKQYLSHIVLHGDRVIANKTRPRPGRKLDRAESRLGQSAS